MQCSEARGQMSAYMDQELDGAASRRVDRHIEQCVSCRDVLHEFQNGDVLLRQLPVLDAGPGFAGKVVARAGEWDLFSREADASRTILSVLMHLVEKFSELLDRKKTPDTSTLDEFGDFPPLSMSCIYFKILGQPGR